MSFGCGGVGGVGGAEWVGGRLGQGSCNGGVVLSLCLV